MIITKTVLYNYTQSLFCALARMRIRNIFIIVMYKSNKCTLDNLKYINALKQQVHCF